MKKKILSLFVFAILGILSINAHSQNNHIWISDHSITMSVHDSALIHVNIPYTTATGNMITATVSDPNIISLHSLNGNSSDTAQTYLVQALSIGSAYIVFTTYDGYFDTCRVTVSNSIPVTGIQVSPHSLTILPTANNIYSLSVNVLPHNATNQSVTIINTDPTVASIDPSTRRITPLSMGSTCIFFRTVDGGYTDSCFVTVVGFDSIPQDTIIHDDQRTMLGGHITRQNNSAVTNGIVCLYYVSQDLEPFGMIDTARIMQDGNYVFYNVGAGGYIIYAMPFDIQGAVSTYYGNTVDWQTATIVNVVDSVPVLNLDIVIVELDSLNGNAVINGYVTEEQGGGKSLSKSSVTAPAKDVNVYLQHKQLKNGEYVFVTIAYARTNEDGFYEFKKIPMGEYKIILDIAGVGMLDAYIVDIIEDGQTMEDQDYEITGNGIKTTKKLGIKPFEQEANAYQIYPNPTNGILIIKNMNGNEKFVDIYSLEGKLVKRNNVSGTSMTMDVQNLTNGVYILHIGNKSIKLIKQ